LILWSTERAAGGAASALETPGTWLAPGEERFAAGLRFPKRRRDWLLGRLAAKRLVQRFLAERGGEVLLTAITLEREPAGAPLVRVNDMAVPDIGPGQLSLTHSHGVAMAALSLTPGTRIGVDLEHVERRSPGFADDFLSDDERCRVRSASAGEARDRVVTTLWSAKEAAVKALGTGLSVDARRLQVTLGDEDEPWTPLTVTAPAAEPAVGAIVLDGSWRRLDDFVLTRVTAVPERKA
jgi:4'-phosphopantetheinyl transferase